MLRRLEERILGWTWTEKKGSYNLNTNDCYDNMEQAYEIQDWLLVFEIVTVNHLHINKN